MGRAICVLLAYALLAAASGTQEQKALFRSGVQTVMLHATVRSNDGRLVPDLTRDDFEVRDEGQPVDISIFSSDPQPITAALLLDMSGSMGRHFVRVRESTAHFVDALHPGDRARIGSFGVELALSPWLTDDKQVLHRIVREELWPGGGTPLWNALFGAMTSLENETGRRVIVVLTDGLAAGTLPGLGGSEDKVSVKAEDGGFMVYAIGMQGSPLETSVTRLADRTGGGFFKLAADADLSSTFLRVVEELRHQYVIGYAPPNADGRMHDVEVRVKKPGMKARARKNYRAPSSR